MTCVRNTLGAVALGLVLLSSGVEAQQIPDSAYTANGGYRQTVPVFSVGVAQSAVTGSVSSATVGTSSAQVLAAGSRRFLAIDNESTTATIACAFGATAAINTAGSFTIPPGVTRTWTAYPVPADAVNCIASAANTPATVEAN